jgi:hypothetical protein
VVQAFAGKRYSSLCKCYEPGAGIGVSGLDGGAVSRHGMLQTAQGMCHGVRAWGVGTALPPTHASICTPACASEHVSVTHSGDWHTLVVFGALCLIVGHDGGGGGQVGKESQRSAGAAICGCAGFVGGFLDWMQARRRVGSRIATSNVMLCSLQC